MLIFLAAAAAAISPTDADQRMSRMVSLYEKVCLNAFPDDEAVEAIMTTQNVRELTPAEVKVTMRDDPARGWALEAENATVWVEFPPFHACSVRWNTPQVGNLQSYRAVAEKYESNLSGFHPMPPYEVDQGNIHIRATGEKRILPDQSTESLFVIDQRITDPDRLAAGETGVVLRFVHQFAPAEPTTAK